MPNYKESEINNQCGPIYVCVIGGKGVVRCPAFVKVKWKWLVRFMLAIQISSLLLDRASQPDK